jgi:glycosyltransferase involved in cell wall biosynthesis
VSPAEVFRPSILVLYHFLPPDDVVSAQVFGGLCEGLAARGWDVTARPSNRSCHDPRARHPRLETWRGVTLRRVRRPGFPQSSSKGRILNALAVTAAWSLEALRPRARFDAVLVGTDPVLSVSALRAFRLLRPGTVRAHWAFDVYPDAAVADGLLRPGSLAARLLSRAAAAGVGAAQLVADLGPCMRSLLPAASGARRETLPPWALVEPPAPLEADPAERRALFGDARLGVLYSGSFGRAHSFDEILALARRLRGTGIRFAFSVRGNRETALRAAVTPADDNVSFAPFVPEGDLSRRLGAADLHAVSLRHEFTGTVVPSKFQAALAAGRPVLFAGSPEAAPARWIAELGLGFHLTADPASVEAAAEGLLALASDPAALAALRARCHAAYAERFSRETTVGKWDAALRELCGLPVAPAVPAPAPA